jgi:hypothetical protein
VLDLDLGLANFGLGAEANLGLVRPRNYSHDERAFLISHCFALSPSRKTEVKPGGFRDTRLSSMKNRHRIV